MSLSRFAGRADDDLDMLDEYARFLQDHPVRAAFDQEAHGRLFEAWCGSARNVTRTAPA